MNCDTKNIFLDKTEDKYISLLKRMFIHFNINTENGLNTQLL
jgi:hypothetical protein